jgi:hypothetical protein
MNLVKRVENLELLRRRLAPTEVVPLDKPDDVLAVLAEQVQLVRSDAYAEPTDRARTLVSLSAIALRAMHERDVEARLEAVERVLKLRKDEQKAVDQFQQSRRR